MRQTVASNGRMETYGVGEEDSPAVTNELVEVDRTVGGLSLEVGSSGTQTEADRAT